MTHSDNFIQEIKFLTSGRMMDGWMDGCAMHAALQLYPIFFFLIYLHIASRTFKVIVHKS